jgi:hypothetical protein
VGGGDGAPGPSPQRQRQRRPLPLRRRQLRLAGPQRRGDHGATQPAVSQRQHPRLNPIPLVVTVDHANLHAIAGGMAGRLGISSDVTFVIVVKRKLA